MSGIDELRRTLADHATDITDPHLIGRSASVHRRVTVVRRRRRAAVASGAVAALAVAGGVALLPGRDAPQPADRTVVGVEAPQTLTSLDYTYAFDRSVEGKGTAAAVDLEASGEPRLVSWATSGADDEVTVKMAGSERLVSALPDFRDFVLVPPGDEARVRVEATNGRVGLAVYQLTDQRPEGFTAEGITFRRQVENRTLVDATVGEVGDPDISVHASTPAGGVAYATFCVGAPEGTRLRVGDAAEYVEQDCNDLSTFDPGSAAAPFPDMPAMNGPVRAWIVDEQGTPMEVPDLRLGLGVYVLAADRVGAVRQQVPDVLEVNGHRWRLDSVTPAGSGDRSLSVRAALQGPQLAVLLTSGRIESARPTLDGEETTWLSTELGSPARWVIGQVAAGGEVSVRLHGAVGDDARFALVTYDRAD